jgi:aminoglycoside phosphotransferase family enzyme
MSSAQLELVSRLKNEAAYPHRASRIAIEETQISWVFLTGPFPYKVKKELKFGDILDFSTLRLKKLFCQKEVKINKPLCGDMYHGVVKIVRKDDGIRAVPLKSRGKALEYTVRMVEMPQESRMDNLLLHKKVDLRVIDKLTSILVKFHRSTPTDNRIKIFG